LVSSHGLERELVLLGAVRNDRVQELMSAADVFFLPSAWEGIALTLFEAMACSLPVVAADVGGQRELVDLNCGVLVARGNEAQEVARYTEALVAMIRSPERRREMGRAARQRIESGFHLDQMREGMLRCFQEALRLHVTSPRPQPGCGLGNAAATQAIEYVRLHRVADQLWTERSGMDWRTRLHRLLVSWFKPTYRWGVARGWKWVAPLGERIRKTLLRTA
jgi:hypothetical protein